LDSIDCVGLVLYALEYWDNIHSKLISTSHFLKDLKIVEMVCKIDLGSYRACSRAGAYSLSAPN